MSSLSDDLVDGFKQDYPGLYAAAERPPLGKHHKVPGGGADPRSTRLTRPAKLKVKELPASAWLESSAQRLLAIDIGSTGGTSPRILSLAIGLVDVDTGRVSETFHEYVTMVQPTAPVAPIHGLGFSALQAKATGDFKAVGTRAVEWICARVAGKSTAAFVVWDRASRGDLELLCAELRRHDLLLPTSTTEFGVIDLYPAARASGYKKLDKTAWPSRQPPAGKQQRGGVLLSLRNAATYELGLAAAAEAAPARTPARGAPPRRRQRAAAPAPAESGAATTAPWTAGAAAVAELDETPTTATLCMLGAVAARLRDAAVGKELLYKLTPFSRWAADLVAYEKELREDPVPAGWQERAAPPGHKDGPTFAPQAGRAAKGGPSAALRGAVGTLDEPAAPPTAPPASRGRRGQAASGRPLATPSPTPARCTRLQP